jgi:tetratricopeptide (TPR) repeat protein
LKNQSLIHGLIKLTILETEKLPFIRMKIISLILSLFLGLMPIYGQNEVAIESYNQGISLFNNKDFNGAKRSFDKAIELDSLFTKAFYNRAVCKTDLKDYTGAISDFTKNIFLDSTATDRPYYGRAKVYYLTNNKDAALNDYLKASEKNRLNADACYFAGGIYFEKENYQKAIIQFTNAINIRPDFAEAYHDRGSAKRLLGDNPGAIADYKEATRLRPTLVPAYNNLGSLLRATGDYQGALVEFGYSIKAAPNESSSYVKRGRLKFDMQDYNGALADFDKAVLLNPNDVFAYNNRGCVKNKLKDYQGAIYDFDSAIKMDPNYGYAYLNRGIAKENIRDVKGACKDWNEAIQNGVTAAKQFIDAECN